MLVLLSLVIDGCLPALIPFSQFPFHFPRICRYAGFKIFLPTKQTSAWNLDVRSVPIGRIVSVTPSRISQWPIDFQSGQVWECNALRLSMLVSRKWALHGPAL